MPRVYFQGDHQKLVQDEGSEGDGDDVDEFALEEPEGEDHEDAALVGGDHEPFEEGLVVEFPAFGQVGVQLWV